MSLALLFQLNLDGDTPPPTPGSGAGMTGPMSSTMSGPMSINPF